MAEVESAQMELQPNLRRRIWSEVWDQFTLITDAQGNHRAVCNRCNEVLRAVSRHGTAHLLRHVKTHEAALLLSPFDREEQQQPSSPPLLSPCDGEQQQPPPPSLLPPCGVVVNQINFIITLVAETCTGIAVRFTPIDQIEEQQQRCAAYSQKALPFAITMFYAYMGAPSTSRSNMTFKIAVAAFFVAVPSDLISAARAPKWGRLLTCLSWFLLVLLSYLLLVSFNKDYSYAILPVPIPIAIGLLQLKLRPVALQRIDTDIEAGQHVNSEAHQDLNTSDEAVQDLNNNSTAVEDLDNNSTAVQDLNNSSRVDQDLDDIFNFSAGIVSFGGPISMIIGHFIIGPSKIIAFNPAVFFFFFTVVLGLYLMMITTVRFAALTHHARHLSYLLMLLLLSTLIATLKVWDSGSDSHV